MIEKLRHYKLDRAFTDGVDIILDNAPDVTFRVRLPSQYNRPYSQALYSQLTWQTGEDGSIIPAGDLLATRYAGEDAFLAHCLVSIDGAPAPDNFATEYPGALAELMQKANDLVQDIEARVSDTVGKSATILTGPDDGQDASDSTGNWLPAAG